MISSLPRYALQKLIIAVSLLISPQLAMPLSHPLTPVAELPAVFVNLDSAPSETFSGQSSVFIDQNIGNQPLAFDDEEGRDAGLVCDGLGIEDEDEDEEGSNANCAGLGNHKIFNEYVSALSHHGPDGLPPLYCDLKTFYFSHLSNFFILYNMPSSDYPNPTNLYSYKFFLWDPECLVEEGILCLKCHTKLQRHGHLHCLHHFVDFEQMVWMIGYHYQCPTCLHPDSGNKTVTFRSWDHSILELLPKPLAAEFPAHLSHCSGISHGLFMFMHSCFQHGIGAKQFANALCVQQLQCYDELQLQYLHFLLKSSTLKVALTGKKAELFLPFNDCSNKGFAGFVPGHHFIKSHLQDFNQHTAMLTGEICTIDHSFKVTKQIAKINGVQVFVALLTVTNEKGEIWLCNLVASKSHSQFELALT
ncbi:hypothetical protein GYMLUDRAFT_69852 [Collybiopsis luxurians FD-317 M1]|nr:hypothetical protein GYMLUDRAFT_69852 [Collybiopsis luxurians FD-317 M1]